MSEVPSLVQLLRASQLDGRLLDEVFRYEAKIDGEWGCGHDAEEIENGLCLDVNPNEIPLVRLLAEALGIG